MNRRQSLKTILSLFSLTAWSAEAGKLPELSGASYSLSRRIQRFSNVRAPFSGSEDVALAAADTAYQFVCHSKTLTVRQNEHGAKHAVDAAMTAIDVSLRRMPDSPVIIGYRSYVQFLAGDVTAARRSLSQAISLGGKELIADVAKFPGSPVLPQDARYLGMAKHIWSAAA